MINPVADLPRRGVEGWAAEGWAVEGWGVEV
jgi:hypothetical protein